MGVDLGPEHVAFARRLAAEAELANVRFLERDFEQLAQESLPDFDYVCAHGVLSWIAPPKRRALLDFAGTKLRPGGLLHVSYNAMPGWAAVEPMRRLMHVTSGDVEGDALARAAGPRRRAQLLCDGGAQYFAKNPGARAMLDTAIRGGMPYVVHEYFTEHWEPSYFADVAAEMSEHDLYFVGGLPLYVGVRELVIPPSLAEVFAEATPWRALHEDDVS